MEELRREIGELVQRYTLEPTLKDVFVEGVLDASVLHWYLRESGKSEVIVYEISTVNVPSAILAKHGLTSGEKQRVLALAKELLIYLVNCPVLCVVDADLDRVLG